MCSCWNDRIDKKKNWSFPAVFWWYCGFCRAWIQLSGFLEIQEGEGWEKVPTLTPKSLGDVSPNTYITWVLVSLVSAKFHGWGVKLAIVRMKVLGGWSGDWCTWLDFGTMGTWVTFYSQDCSFQYCGRYSHDFLWLSIPVWRTEWAYEAS